MARYEHPLVETDYRLPYYRRRLVPRLAYHFDLSTIEANPYFNPAHAPAGLHTGFPRMFIQYGDCEIFSDDIRALVQGLQRDGINVEVDEIYGGIHAEGTIKRSFGFKSDAWRQMLGAVKEMGWSAQV
jgi:acetyl esterase/lipase